MMIFGKRQITNNKQNNSIIIMDHQLAVYDHLKTNRALLLFHKMGSSMKKY